MSHHPKFYNAQIHKFFKDFPDTSRNHFVVFKEESPNMPKGLGAICCAFFSLLAIYGCASTPTDSKIKSMVERVPNTIQPQNENVRAGIAALSEKKYSNANDAFNEALRLEPANAGFHYLNALAYHLRAENGETSLIDSAETGYQVALKLDPRMYLSASQLAMIRMKQKRYPEAVENLSHALLFEPEDPSLWLSLSAASYYTQDLTTANAAIQRAEKLSPQNPEIQRSLALINAASGEGKSQIILEKISKDHTALDLKHIEKRINDWEQFHRRVAEASSNKADDADDSDSKKGGSEKPETASRNNSPRMCSIDVVLIQSTENRTTKKGLNLLTGLTLQFANVSTFANTWSNSRNTTGTLTGTASSESGSGVLSGTATRTGTLADGNNQSITNTISVPAVTYNLNIFNDGRNTNEIIARPTLIALDGQSSEFFSGGTLKVGLQGVAGSQGTVQDLPVGVKLKVTPTFLSDNQIKLAVETSREFPELNITTSTFSQSFQTAKTTVQANVVMNFDDTLILSGLSEKDISIAREGVPFLKDIPVIQYFFSTERKLDLTKSVLVLLTPRREQYTHVKEGLKPDVSDPRVSYVNLGRLKKRFDWFRPAPNLANSLTVLDSSDYFTEFRTGDVNPDNWTTSDSIGRRLSQALDFLYY